MTLHVFRQEVRPFSDVELGRLEAFAQQASLAIANADLFNDLDESLALQTATSEVLELISAHPGELDVVLEGIIERTTQLVDATVGLLWLRSGDDLICRAQVPPASQNPEQWVGTTLPASELRANARAAERRRPIFVDDVTASIADDDKDVVKNTEVRSFVTIPLFHDGEWIGNINVGRNEVRPFDEGSAAILQAFADQAALAVANAQLFNDLDAALERQTAMTDVLDAVSTAREDLQPVFEAVAHHAARLCDNVGAALLVREGDALIAAARSGVSLGTQDTSLGYFLGIKVPIDADVPTAEAARTGAAVHIRDWDEVPEHRFPTSDMRSWGRRTTLSLPLMRNKIAVGVINFSRDEPGGYADDEMALLRAFADQAAIAVDNARLLREIEERNTDLSESLELQTATSEALRLISTHPGDLTTVLEAIVTKAAGLCDAPFGSVL